MKYVLVLQFKPSSEAQFDELIDFEEHLTANLTGFADVDGHDFGSGEMNIFILCNEPLNTFREVRKIL